MKVIPTLSALALVFGAGMSMAHAAAPAAAQPVVKTTCQDYLALDETIKPKFIYYAVGHGAKGKRDAILDIEGTETIQPELDEFCKLNLSKSAYDHVMQSSMASERGKAKAKK